MMDVINVAAYWKVYKRTGLEIDRIENTLLKDYNLPVSRTETMNEHDNYDATFCVKGKADAKNFIDACHFMSDVDAYPY